MYIETMAKVAKMTRKDFQLIADVLKASGTSPMNRCVIKDVAMNFAVELQKTNPRFDVQRFVKACMPPFRDPVEVFTLREEDEAGALR